MKIRELLLCGIDPKTPNTDPSPTISPVAQMQSGPTTGKIAPIGPNSVDGTPSSQGGMQMAQNAPVSMMPNNLADQVAATLTKADSIAYGPFGSKTPNSPSGNYFSQTVGRPPLPLR